MSRIQTTALTITVAIVAAAAGLLLSRAFFAHTPAAPPALATATLLDPARPLPAMQFTDHTGRPFGEDRLRGRWSLLFFGFTSCPDVCPTTLGVLAQTEKLLHDLPPAQRPRVILVSVDPERDTPAQLAAYVNFFSTSFTGITASPAIVREFTRQMGVPVAITPLEGGGYTVDHSAAIFLVNPDGAMQALFSAPHSPRPIADDYRRITALPGA